jgi:hypothetical protein
MYKLRATRCALLLDQARRERQQQFAHDRFQPRQPAGDVALGLACQRRARRSPSSPAQT